MLHSDQSCEVKVKYNDEAITSWLHSFCDFDYKCSCVSAISSVYLFLFKSESGGLVHVTNKYSELNLVFVLLHIGSSRSPANVACHTVAYGEKPRDQVSTIHHQTGILKSRR
jgi:hypothetical protein